MHQRRKGQLQLIQTSTQFASDRQGKHGRANMQVYGADKVWNQALVLAVAADWDNELLDLGEVDTSTRPWATASGPRPSR